jgi:hypothetical protein
MSAVFYTQDGIIFHTPVKGNELDALDKAREMQAGAVFDINDQHIYIMNNEGVLEEIETSDVA